MTLAANKYEALEWEDGSITQNHFAVLVIMPLKYVQNTVRNMTSWMNLGGNGFAVWAGFSMK